ncbi:MAG: GAF domain-containing protein [Candidatus Aenigmarchaeota archaeon]|nr:GAF domain-containing protein [Candidatus Aenigmarchaeota archaeon]
MNKERKVGLYNESFEEIKAVLKDETDMTACMATINSILANKFAYYFWCGFYLVGEKKELIIGPYRGTVACLRISYDRGVCGACATKEETIIVPNVHEFPGHIACDSKSNSEIVVPVFNKDKKLIAIYDIDSKEFNSFDETDKEWVEKIVKILKDKI